MQKVVRRQRRKWLKERKTVGERQAKTGDIKAKWDMQEMGCYKKKK